MASLNDPTDAFLQHVDAHRGILGKVVRSYAWNQADREDLEQEILVQLWRAWPKYDPARKFSTWMYRIALNVAISQWRRQAHRPETTVETLPDPLVTTPDRADQQEQIALLHQFLNGLESLPRALMLLYLEGYSHAEIGDALGISTSNVGTRVHRIKQQLKQFFDHVYSTT